MAKVFKIKHLGNLFTWQIPEFNTSFPYAMNTQFNVLYTEDALSELLNDFTTSIMNNSPVNLGGRFYTGGVDDQTALTDLAERLNTAWKIIKDDIDRSDLINDKKMKILDNGDFINPNNDYYFNYTYQAASDNYYYYVYDDDGVLVDPSNNPVNDLLSHTFVCSFIAFTDFNSFATADTWAEAYTYARELHIMGIVRGTNTYLSCRCHDNGQYMEFAKMLWLLLGNSDPSEESSDDPYSGDNSPYSPSGPGGGGGDGADPGDTGDDIPVPDLPTVSIADTGLIDLYTPNPVQLNLLASYLWSSNFVDSMVKDLYADPMQVIISIGLMPFNIIPAGVKNIKVGDRDSGVSANYPTSNYYQLNCGTVYIPTTIGAYIDYAPYTKASLYLPYVGMIALDVDYVMGKTLGVVYNIDLCTGSAIAFVTANSKIIGSYSCNIMIPVPLTSANYSAMWGSVLAATAALAGAGIAAGAAAGGAATAGAASGTSATTTGAKTADIVSKAGSDIMTGLATKPSIQKSNNISSTTGLLGYKKPYVTIERPALALPADQNKLMGYPSFVTATIGSVTGFIKVSSIDLVVPGATGNERLAIEQALAAGVHVQSGSFTGSGIVLGINRSSNNTIGKTITTVDTFSTGTFKEDIDIEQPVFTLEYNSPAAFDYVYISHFNRCYYVDKVIMLRKNLMEVHCSVDPLQSHSTAIKANKAIIEKAESSSLYNLYLNDGSLKTYQYPQIWTKNFTNGFGTDYEYVLIVAGN